MSSVRKHTHTHTHHSDVLVCALTCGIDSNLNWKKPPKNIFYQDLYAYVRFKEKSLRMMKEKVDQNGSSTHRKKTKDLGERSVLIMLTKPCSSLSPANHIITKYCPCDNNVDGCEGRSSQPPRPPAISCWQRLLIILLWMKPLLHHPILHILAEWEKCYFKKSCKAGRLRDSLTAAGVGVGGGGGRVVSRFQSPSAAYTRRRAEERRIDDLQLVRQIGSQPERRARKKKVNYVRTEFFSVPET